MRDLLVTLIVFSSLPFILVRPYVGILVWSWLGYMNPHRLSWGFAYDFPFALVVAIVTLVALLFSNEPKRIPWTSVTVVLLLFVLWMNVTTYFALNPEQAWPQWGKVMKIMLMTYVTLILIQSRERLHLLVWVIALSIAFFGIKGGIFTITRGGQFMVVGPAGSFIPGNTEIALALTMVLPLVRYLQLCTERLWLRHAFTVAMALMGLSIVGSYSRGALLAGAAMALFLFLKSRKRWLLGMVLVLVVPAMLAFMPEKWSEKMGTILTYQEDGSAMGRINAWGFAYNLALDRPVVGGGFEVFVPQYFLTYAPDPEDFHDAHSIYFEVLGEHGFVGLALYLALGYLAWRTGGWTIRRARGHPELKWARDLASMVQVSLIGYAVGGAFLGLAYFDLFYHLVAILVLTRLVTERALREAREPSEVPAAQPAGMGGLARMGGRPGGGL